MNAPILWMLWVMVFVSFGTYLYLGITHYLVIKKTPFRFFQQLPFELHDIYFDHRQRVAPFRFLIVLGAVSLFAYWEGMFIYPSIPLSFVLLAMMTIFLLSMLGSFILQPKKIEMYIAMVTLYLVSIVAILFLSSYLTFMSPFSQWQTFLPWTTLGQGILQLLLVLNPRLKQWAVLEKVEAGNEKPLYRRPAHFVMAYTQWLSLANVLLWVILTQIEWFIV